LRRSVKLRFTPQVPSPRHQTPTHERTPMNVLRRSCLLACLLIQSAPLWGATYHVDSNSGNDANSGLSPGVAWRSLAKVNSVTFFPGDSILFARGGTWTGQLAPSGAGSS